MSVCRVQLASGGYLIVPGMPDEIQASLGHPQSISFITLTDTFGNEAQVRQGAVEAIWELPHYEKD